MFQTMMNKTNVKPCTESEAAESLLSLVNVISNSQPRFLPHEKMAKVEPPQEKNDDNTSRRTTKEVPVVVVPTQNDATRPTASGGPAKKRKVSSSHQYPLLVNGRVNLDNTVLSKFQDPIPSRVNCTSPLTTSSIDSDASTSAPLPPEEVIFGDDSSTSSTTNNSKVFSEESIDHCSAIRSKRRAMKSVPEILMHLLLNPEENLSTMHFLPDNEAFVISNMKKFSTSIMRKWFKLTKFGCFIGKLQRWGFYHRSNDSTPESHLFHHPCFKKDDWTSLLKIKYSPRRTTTNNKIDPKDENNRASIGFNITSSFRSIQETIDRHIELTAMSNKLRKDLSPQQESSVLSFLHPTTCAASKKIVSEAIECLLRDEEHTKSLLLRNHRAAAAGDKVRQYSTPCQHSDIMLKLQHSIQSRQRQPKESDIHDLTIGHVQFPMMGIFLPINNTDIKMKRNKSIP